MKPTAGILDYAETHPEATPLCPAGLLHLGNRTAVDYQQLQPVEEARRG